MKFLPLSRSKTWYLDWHLTSAARARAECARPGADDLTRCEYVTRNVESQFGSRALGVLVAEIATSVAAAAAHACCSLCDCYGGRGVLRSASIHPLRARIHEFWSRVVMSIPLSFGANGRPIPSSGVAKTNPFQWCCIHVLLRNVCAL